MAGRALSRSTLGSNYKMMVLALLAAILFFMVPTPSLALELTGHVAAEGRYFPSEPLYQGQEKNDSSIAIQPELYHEWDDGSSLIFVPYARFDNNDDERSHYDIREFNFLWVADQFEARIGIGKIFWGATEFVHLVDIINQSDLVENIDGEEKLGQPMISLSWLYHAGSIDFFVLPYFRERRFPGEKGRLRTPLVVNTDNALYEDRAKQEHVDYAAHLTLTLGDFDLGLYYFNGTSREPLLIQSLTPTGQPIFIPYYEQIRQTGLDITGAMGEWLLKMEAMYRWDGREDFYAVVGGFEYTIVGIAGSMSDLGIIAEYAYDERGVEGASLNQNDSMFGLRLAVNDQASTELLAGFLNDTNMHSRAASVVASRRIGDNMKLTLEGWFFIDPPEDDIALYSIRDDDFIRLEIALYY